MGRPAIFLDRDGVLNENRVDHVKSWSEFHFLPGVLDALAALRLLNVPIVAITNQAIVHRGLVHQDVIEDIHLRMCEQVRQASGQIDRVYYCPHRPDERCACRKPAPGLLLQAADDLGLDLRRSVLVGDAESDIAAGSAAGCATVLVLTGRGQQARRAALLSGHPQPDRIARDLQQAVDVISQLLRERAGLAELDPLLQGVD